MIMINKTIIIKKFGQRGSLYYEAIADDKFYKLYDYLDDELGDTDLQVVLVSNKDAYKEYAPFTQITSSKELTLAVFSAINR